MDEKRWQQEASYQRGWGDRARMLARQVRDGETVIEFGCGRMQLKEHLPPGCAYTPTDQQDVFGLGVKILDLNAAELPEIRADVAVFSGVLEYLFDVPRVIGWLSGQARAIVCSYAVSDNPDHQGLMRLHNGWVNAFRERDLVRIMKEHGYRQVWSGRWYGQRLYRFEKAEGICLSEP